MDLNETVHYYKKELDRIAKKLDKKLSQNEFKNIKDFEDWEEHLKELEVYITRARNEIEIIKNKDF